MSLIEQDYIVRLIYEIIRTLFRLIFRIDLEKKNGYQFEVKYRQQRYEKLILLADKGKINEAENQLLTSLNVYEIQDLELALRFYLYLNEKENAYLEMYDFTRKEIVDGIRMVCRIFGYGNMADSLMEDLEMEEI